MYVLSPFKSLSDRLLTLMCSISAAILNANPMDVKLWHSSFWMFTGVSAFALILCLLFAEETYYNRAIFASRQPAQSSRFARMTGFGRVGPSTRYTLKEATLRFFSTFVKSEPSSRLQNPENSH